ncbi:unnamed protein product, partial [Mesorhabditis belari]|uniref:RING-type domain-containing protein n=1 Tax=Mesorhabditis belari TaxID=2138241 RepID=A0AAF3JC41_9BILA
MHQACPRTCNLCNDTFPSLTQFAPRRKCEDEASDCEESLELCDNLMFRNLMRKQCAYSCGFCSGRYQPTTKKPKIATKKRGKSKSRRVKEEDEEEEEEKEDEISIIDVMKLIRGHETTEGTTTSTSTSTTTTTTVTTLPCRDRAIDCQAKAGLCDHRNYQNLMRRDEKAKITLTDPISTEIDEKIALSRRIEKHWRLIALQAKAIKTGTRGGEMVSGSKMSSQPILKDSLGCRGVDSPSKIMAATHNGRLIFKAHKRLVAIEDDEGLVLVSFPINIEKGQNFSIELFHCTRFLMDKSGGKLRIPVQLNNNTPMLLHNAVISRNFLYLFDTLDSTKCIAMPVSGAQAGKANILITKGDQPTARYFLNSVLQPFDAFVLVYVFSDPTSAKNQPLLYELDLTSFTFRLLNLQLSSHFPRGKVCISAGGNDTIYLQGDCLQKGCAQLRHFYRIDLLPLLPRLKMSTSSAIPSTSSDFSATSSISALSLNSIASTASSATPQTVPQRYEKRRGRTDKKTMLMKDRTKSLDSLSLLSSTSRESRNSNDSVTSTPRRVIKEQIITTPLYSEYFRVPSLHWSTSMPEEGQTSLQDQLRWAKEMGFGDDVIMKALSTNSEDPDAYVAFENTNTMLDCLQRVQREMKQPTAKLSIYNEPAQNGEVTSTKLLSPRSSSVSRAASLNLGTSAGARMTRSDSHDINRLITTLDREQERTRKEVESHIARLKERIRTLESQLQDEKSEREKYEEKEMQMVNQLKDAEDNLRSEQEENKKLRRELSQNKLETDNLTVKKLHLQKAVADQRELSAHRKQKFEEEIKEKDLQISQLQATLATSSVSQQRLAELETENRQLNERLNNHEASSSALTHELSETSALCDRLQRRFDSAEQQIVKCCVCLEQKPEIVFFPCLHVCVCDGCFTREPMSKCPTCRARLVGSSKPFFTMPHILFESDDDEQKSVNGEQHERMKAKELKAVINEYRDPVDDYEKKNKELEKQLKRQQQQILNLKSELVDNYLLAQSQKDTLKKEIEELMGKNRNSESLAREMELQVFNMGKKLEELEEKMQERENNRPRCCVCMENTPEILLMSCFHLCLCQGCFDSEWWEKCPTCRTSIIGFSKVFFG